MAEKKVTKAEDKQIKPIILKDDNNGDIFVLEFDRDTVKFAETTRGLKPQVVEGNLGMTEIEDLFFCSFRKHHPKLSKADTDKILYERLGGITSAMLTRLYELFEAPYTTLISDDTDRKNVTMAVEF